MTSVASNETDPGIARIGRRHQTVSKGSKRTFIKRECERYEITSVLTSRKSCYQPTHATWNRLLYIIVYCIATHILVQPATLFLLWFFRKVHRCTSGPCPTEYMQLWKREVEKEGIKIWSSSYKTYNFIIIKITIAVKYKGSYLTLWKRGWDLKALSSKCQWYSGGRHSV